MARMTAIEKREQQERAMMRQSFNTLREGVNMIAERKVLEIKDVWSNATLSKNVQTVIAEVHDIENKRQDLQRTLASLADRMTDDIRRLNKGRCSDDITRNSSFTNLAADTALFNFRLQQVHRAADRERIYVWELFPHLTKNELELIVVKASELFARMSAQQEITGEIVAAFREEMMKLERELF